jgi:hypothetical protein
MSDTQTEHGYEVEVKDRKDDNRMLDTSDFRTVTDLVYSQLELNPEHWRRQLTAIEEGARLLATVEFQERPELRNPPDTLTVYDAIYRGPGGLGRAHVGQLIQTGDPGQGVVWRAEVLGRPVNCPGGSEHDARYIMALYLRDLRKILDGDRPL